MYFLFFPTTIFFWACEQQAEKIQTEPDYYDQVGFGVCNKYDPESSAYGFCLYKQSETIKTIPDLEVYCARSKKWESECIYNWVSTRIPAGNGYSTETLLDLCGDIKDCAFRVIDMRPRDDVLDQIDLCKKYVVHNYRDCVLHAMITWRKRDPDEEDVMRLMHVPESPNYFFGFYLSGRIYCDGVGTCSGSPNMEKICKDFSTEFASKRQACPSFRKGRDGIYKVPDGVLESKDRYNDAMRPNRR